MVRALTDGGGDDLVQAITSPRLRLVDSGAYVRQSGIWNVLQVGRLCVCSATWTADTSYIQNAWGSSLLESTEELRPPNYPVTFSSLPASHVDYVGADAGYQGACLVERHSATASTTNAGGLWLVRPTGATSTVGHPRIAITAVGWV